MQIPTRITAGDTVTWTEPSLTDPQGQLISSASHGVQFSFRGPVVISDGDVVGTPLGSGWQLTLPSAMTAEFNSTGKVAKWYWQAYATKDGARSTIGSGVLNVAANFAALAGVVDGRSTSEQILANIEATILARTTGNGVAEYTVGNRSLKYMPMAELLSLKSRYQLVVARERRRQGLKNGLGAPDRIGIRFR